ncbi:pyridoxamine 5'-phosphate oxidase family protein [Falsibacillus pallidus]|uniref:pyridoxamine 5'-phosphate oxidase family protein n=1 Tax=Falsibacillus pallidus TaxID=493781 RepID=UPI001B86F61F|nr:pyridoxamine 5'-phosphate oxidase family protein [Falsibacillus pallidus]
MTKGNGFGNLVESEAELRAIVGHPSELVQKKVITYLDHNCTEFIAQSPFLVLSTSDDSGYCDASPRGDKPGFVHVLNEKQMIIPERPGNKRIDSLRNILVNPKVGLLFFIPGLGETLRVNGTASIVKDEELLREMAVGDKVPQLGIGIEVEECFIHCAKAFKRSGLWEPDTWLDKNGLPSAAKMLFEHAKLSNSSEEEIHKRLEEGYANKLY